jgi:osmoprotectant transport system ATP-binding protein
MSFIEVEGLTRQFEGQPVPAVDGVSFAGQRGELIVLLGPSGCGKTTLLKMLNRLYEPTSGRVLIDGVDTRSMPVTNLRRRIGYVIQQAGLFPHLRIEQNIAVVPELLGWERQRIDARIDELLDLIGLARSYRTRYPRQLSGGEQQRVGLARALAADPAMMLMDEPFGALDAITRSRLQEELLQIQRRVTKTILFVTHDVDEALRLADRMIVMRSGSIVQFGAPLELLSHPRDDFVARLLDTENVLRRLSLLRVRDVMLQAPSGPPPPGQAVVHIDDDLRSVLIALLTSPVEALPVADGHGAPVGRVGFEQIRMALGVQAQPTMLAGDAGQA